MEAALPELGDHKFDRRVGEFQNQSVRGVEEKNTCPARNRIPVI